MANIRSNLFIKLGLFRLVVIRKAWNVVSIMLNRILQKVPISERDDDERFETPVVEWLTKRINLINIYLFNNLGEYKCF